MQPRSDAPAEDPDAEEDAEPSSPLSVNEGTTSGTAVIGLSKAEPKSPFGANMAMLTRMAKKVTVVTCDATRLIDCSANSGWVDKLQHSSYKNDCCVSCGRITILVPDTLPSL